MMATGSTRTLPLPVVLAGAVSTVALVGFLDYITGVEVRIFPLYFLPVAFTSWYASMRWSFVTAVLSGLAWMASNVLAGRDYSSGMVWGINLTTQTVTFIVVAALISELRNRLAAEEGLSRTDSLTQLLNSRAFYERAEGLLAQARRYDQPTTFAYLDLDHFKIVNDLYGHQQGDEVLRQVAAIFRQEARASDLLARVGGDEFILLLPNTGAEGAAPFLQRICETTAELMRQRRWPVTVSVGAVSFLRAPSSVEAGVSRTDSAMYEAKSKGRNQVHLEVRADDVAPVAPGPPA